MKTLWKHLVNMGSNFEDFVRFHPHTYLPFFKKLGFTPCKAEQPLRGMELEQKKHKRDYRIQRMFRKNLLLKDVC